MIDVQTSLCILIKMMHAHYDRKPASYWKNTSDNAIIRSFIDYAGEPPPVHPVPKVLMRIKVRTKIKN